MMMALRKMEDQDWLLVDNLYLPEQQFRRDLLSTNREGVMQILPGMDDVCEELLETVVQFLLERYPEYFQREDEAYIYNALMDERVRVVKPWNRSPLEIAACLVMEDINLLVKRKDDEYYLRASFTMAPAGWDLRERIGWPIHKIHKLVPGWQRKLGKRVKRGLSALNPGCSMERDTYFIQTSSELFQQQAFPESVVERPRVEDLHVRAERQTLRKLPRTKAIVFMVRTYMTPLTDLVDDKESLENLRSAVRAWPEDLGRYKGRNVWGAVFEDWCDEVLEKN
ncbi:mannosyl transferase protein [Rutstroemia sp. NJR-2017a BBW]|nr:mannosyl transferase protein [Rutstroemia sp. NJR-2017a BBW]